MARGNWPWYGAVSAEELAAPTTSAGLRAYYAPGAPAAPAIFRGYRAERGQAKAAYKQLLDFCQAWGDRAGFRGYFSLNNMSPMAAPCFVPRARDMLDTDKRYAGIFMPRGFPPTGALWTGMSHLHIDSLFMNNYGTHCMSFKAKLTAFAWDWTNMCAPIAGCGCITVNDQLCAWTRWTPAGLDKVDDLATPALGARVYEIMQIARP